MSLNNPKICKQKYVIDEICLTCQDYVGLTRQLLHERAHQHHTSLIEAIYQHIQTHNHIGLPFSYKILSKCSSLKDLLFYEAIYIKRIEPTLNRRQELEDVIRFIE